MKYTKQLLVAGLMLSLNIMTAEAALLSRGGGTMVYDTDLDVTWVADANLFKTQISADPTLANTIIANVGFVFDSGNSHFLTASDFYSSVGSPGFGTMSWWGAQAWVENLNYGGVSDWRLPNIPTAPNYSVSLNSELGHLFYNELGGTAYSPIATPGHPNVDPFINMANSAWWGSEYAPYTAWKFNPVGTQDLTSKSFGFSAWAVRNGDIAAVPVPAAVWLFGSALLGLAGLKRRNRIA